MNIGQGKPFGMKNMSKSNNQVDDYGVSLHHPSKKESCKTNKVQIQRFSHKDTKGLMANTMNDQTYRLLGTQRSEFNNDDGKNKLMAQTIAPFDGVSRNYVKNIDQPSRDQMCRTINSI